MNMGCAAAMDIVKYIRSWFFVPRTNRPSAAASERIFNRSVRICHKNETVKTVLFLKLFLNWVQLVLILYQLKTKKHVSSEFKQLNKPESDMNITSELFFYTHHEHKNRDAAPEQCEVISRPSKQKACYHTYYHPKETNSVQCITCISHFHYMQLNQMFFLSGTAVLLRL